MTLKTDRIKKLLFATIPLFILFSCTAEDNLQAIKPGSSEEVVKLLYKAVSVEAGHQYDWDYVRSLFIENPVIVLRTSREKSTVFTMEGFVDDFKKFVEKASIIDSGFKEEIIEMKTLTIGDISNIIVVYEASILGSDRPPLRGIDMIHLIKTVEGWKISGIVNEIPDPSRPLILDLSSVDLINDEF